MALVNHVLVGRQRLKALKAGCPEIGSADAAEGIAEKGDDLVGVAKGVNDDTGLRTNLLPRKVGRQYTGICCNY